MRIRTPAGMLRRHSEVRTEEITAKGEHLQQLIRVQDLERHLEAERLIRTDKDYAIAAVRNNELAAEPMYSPSMGFRITPLGSGVGFYDTSPNWLISRHSTVMQEGIIPTPTGMFVVGQIPAAFVATFWHNKARREVAKQRASIDISNQFRYSLAEHTATQLLRDTTRRIRMAKRHIVRSVASMGISIIGFTFFGGIDGEVVSFSFLGIGTLGSVIASIIQTDTCKGNSMAIRDILMKRDREMPNAEPVMRELGPMEEQKNES